MESREDWETDGRTNSNCVGKWKRSTREEKIDNARETGEIAGAVFPHRQEEMRPSAQTEGMAFARSSSGRNMHRCREVVAYGDGSMCKLLSECLCFLSDIGSKLMSSE